MISRWGVLGLGALVVFGRVSAQDLPVAIGERVDLGSFGQDLRPEDGTGLAWENPRDIEEVRVGDVPPAVGPSLRVEWWGSAWPKQGTGGWMQLDDPWNGEWVRISAEPVAGPSGDWRFVFPPLGRKEFDRALADEEYPGRKPPVFRRTLKIRLVTDQGKEPPRGLKLTAFGRSRWNQAVFNVEVRLNADGASLGRIEVANGHLLETIPLAVTSACSIEGSSWRAKGPAGTTAGVRVRLAYAENADPASADLTRVTVRLGDGPSATGFTFAPQQVLPEEAIRVPDFGAMVTVPESGLTLANDPGPSEACWDRPVRARVAQRPEMTRAAAMAGIPRLMPLRWIPLGVPSARQEFFVGPNGDWSVMGMSVNADSPEVFQAGREAKRICFNDKQPNRLADEMFTRLDTQEQPTFEGGDRQEVTRYLDEGCLPLIHVEWRTGPIYYHHALGAATLEGEYADDVARRGDEPVVLLTRLEVSNTSDEARPAWVHLRYSQAAPLKIRPDGVIAIQAPVEMRLPEGLTAMRGQISMDAPSGGGAEGWSVLPPGDPACSAILSLKLTLKPKERRSVYFKATYVDLLDAQEVARLDAFSFEEQIPRMLDYWRARLARGMLLDVPDPMVRHFYNANLWHICITTDRDPTTGLYNQGVGTVRYRVFANETVMIARAMDMRGEHAEAERFLEPLLRYQGHEPLTGRFSTKDGVFHSAGAYTHGQYAMNHGFVLWGVADHYLLSGDRAYLERVAPQLVKGCDFLVHERTATMTPRPDGRRSPVHGLCPASSLEDVIEFQYWFATNGYFYLGMKKVAEALADIRHPEAGRLAREAERYRQDIEIAARQASATSLVARLRDGTYVPYVPSRVFQRRHLTEGWIREALYPSLSLATAEVVAPDDPMMSWMLDDLEDNIFFSPESGFGVRDVDRWWFERGAVTLQPCLVDTPVIYMARNEIHAALRSFWNTYALLIYPDVQCFAEWARRFGEGGGPVYKTSDEARFVMWVRQLLVWENGRVLWFGRAMPREWLEHGKTTRIDRAVTLFGSVGLSIRSEVAHGQIRAAVTLPDRRMPSEVWLRLRHPGGLRPLRVLADDVVLPPEQLLGEDIRLPTGPESRGRTINLKAEYR